MPLPAISECTILLADESNQFTCLLTLFSFELKRSIETPSATLSFTVDTGLYGTYPGDDMAAIAKERLKLGRMVQLSIENKTQFTGYITNIKRTTSEASGQLVVSCNDVIWRLENTTLNHMRSGLNGKQGLVKLTEFALDGLKSFDAQGLPDKADANDWFYSDKFTIYYDQAASLKAITGKLPISDVTTDVESIKESDAKPKENETIYAFLKRMITPWGYLLQADGEGNLIFFRPNTTDEVRHWFVNDDDKQKVYSDNTIAMVGQVSLEQSCDNSHSHYYVFAPNISKDKVATRASHSYANPEFTTPRNNCFFYTQNVHTQAACAKVAKRKVGFEIAKAWRYTFTVPALAISGVVLSTDTCVMVTDTFNELESQNVYVLEISMVGNANNQQTTLTCVKTTALVLE